MMTVDRLYSSQSKSNSLASNKMFFLVRRSVPEGSHYLSQTTYRVIWGNMAMKSEIWSTPPINVEFDSAYISKL